MTDYDPVYRGRMLTVRTPPAADLVIGKLKRLDPEDMADIQYLIVRHSVDVAALREAFGRLPDRWQRDSVLTDNLRYVIDDLWGEKS